LNHGIHPGARGSLTRLVAAAMGIAALAACGNPVAELTGTDPGPATALLLGFHRGEAMRFQFKEELKGELIGANKDIKETLADSGIETITVTDVAADGSLTLDILLEQAKVTENGKPVKVPQVGKHFKVMLAPDGQIKTGDELNTQSKDTQAANQLPGSDQWTPLTKGNQKVHVGDSWQQSYDRPFTGGEGMIHEDDLTQFVRWETINKRQAAVVQTTYSIDNLNVALSFRNLLRNCGCQVPQGFDPRLTFAGKLNGVETNWVDTKQNQLLKSESSGFFDLTIGFRDFPPSVTPNGDFSFSGSDSLKVQSLKITPPGTVL
jgi:hypothetical protein